MNYGVYSEGLAWYGILCGVLLIIPQCCIALPAQELFLRANYLYAQGQVQQALELYQALEPKGSATWYNMGACWHRLGNDVQALACWRHAQRGASLKERRMIAQAIAAIHAVDGQENTLGAYLRVLPIALVQFCILLGLCLLFFCTKWWYYGLHGKCMLLAAGVLLCVGGASLWLQYQEWYQKCGIVLARTTVYSGPNENFHMQGTLEKVTEVAVDKVHGSWCKVAHNELIGWVPADAIVVV